VDREEYIPVEWENVCCPICHSDNKKLYHTFGNQLQYSYMYCMVCGIVYQSPRPKYDKAFLEAAYEKYFVFNPHYEYSNKELEEFSPEVEEILKFDQIKSSLLDVGSCMGSFLKAALEKYPVVEGIEISDSMASFTERKLNVKIFQTQFSEFVTDKKYSCIHLSHVLEHIPNPNEWLQKAYELLEDNGVLVICVPNMFSLSRRIKLLMRKTGLRSGRWKELWRTPDHLFEPTIRGMKYLFNQNNFSILNYYTYSRKDPVSGSRINWLIQRKFKIGSNLRYYLKKV
jgi:2-polyprenyl-3-methyl-5-hydroxy-6-metoxy-1,4-benzoquinol methylase